MEHISCAPGAHIGEAIAREYLMHELATSQGILLTNYHHMVGNGTQENDLVLINEQGVWAIEVKHWYGRIDADTVYWVHNGYRHHSPVISVEGKARTIASTLRQVGFDNISVVGLVVLTRHEAKFRKTLQDDHWRKIFRLSQPLIKAVTGTEYLYHKNNQRLSPTIIKNISDTLVTYKVDPKHHIVGSYRILREVESGDGFDAYEAQHTMIERRRARIKRYQVTGYRNKEELDAAVQRFARDMHALEELEGHPNIVNAYDFMNDPDSDDTYWLTLEWIEGGTLLDRLDEDDPIIPFAEQLRILHALASALEACHSKGIQHRNLTPASIYMADNGNVQLGDFDFARVPGVGKTISITGKPLVTNKYTAPEMRDTFRPSDERCDLYSLGAIWYDMALRPTEQVILLPEIDKADIPHDAKELMRSLLASQPTKRPKSATDVRELLEILRDEG